MELGTYTGFPDVQPAILDALETALGDDVTVAADLTGYHAGDKYVTVKPGPGGTFPLYIRQASPRFDVNVYAKTKPEAMALSLSAVKAMMELKNHVGTDFVIQNIEVTYPQDLSDPINHNPRYVFDLVVTYRFR